MVCTVFQDDEVSERETHIKAFRDSEVKEVRFEAMCKGYILVVLRFVKSCTTMIDWCLH